MSEKEVPLCVNCAWLIGRRSMPEFAAAWKCGAKENIVGVKTDIVTGEKRNLYNFHDCAAARDEIAACGPEGAWFELYEVPKPLVLQSTKDIHKGVDDIMADLGGTA